MDSDALGTAHSATFNPQIDRNDESLHDFAPEMVGKYSEISRLRSK